MENKKNNSIKEVYRLLKTNETDKLYDNYLVEDQKIVMSAAEDYFDSSFVTNKVKNILEEIDARKLTRMERSERRYILWLWYHHGISYAIWSCKNKKMAITFSKLALKYQPKEHTNTITRLLYFLIRDKLNEAELWLKKVNRDEIKTAKELIKFYKEGGFFN